LTLLTEEYDRLTPSYQAQTAEICLDLLAMAFGSSEAPSSTAQFPQRSSGALLLSRVKAFIHCHLTDPELSPTMIAERHNISKRYLQSIFARTGGTLCGWIKDERLSRAYAQLTDPRADYLSVTEIALRQGFNDIPHFTRQFKVKYGQSPTQVRHKPLVDA
jgi:AraC-like DNA-binding protein